MEKVVAMIDRAAPLVLYPALPNVDSLLKHIQPWFIICRVIFIFLVYFDNVVSLLAAYFV